MKDKLLKNVGLKILSFLIAIFVWLVIVNADDPVMSKTFRNIPVTPINEEAIIKINQVYTITEGENVDVTVRGRQSVVDSLRSTDIKAEADLSALSDVNATYINVSCTKDVDADLELSLGKVKMLKVSLEALDKSKFPLYIKQNGEVDSGYYISDKTASPNIITVEGPESVISKIDSVIVEADVSGRTSSFQQAAKPKVYDKNGDLIDSSQLKFSSDEIAVNFTLVKTKEVRLVVNPVGDTKNGYKRTEFDYEPKKVTIAGDSDALDRVTYISIDYDISGKYQDIEENLAIGNDIKDDYGVIPVDENQAVAISAKFEKLDSTTVPISKKDIDIRNVPTGYTVDINTDDTDVLVRGSSQEIRNLRAADISPYIDVKGYGVGTRIVALQFPNNSLYEMLTKPVINITIRASQN